MSAKSFTINLKSKIKSYKKVIDIDSDKSLSIRSFIIGSICQKISFANNILESEDVKSAISTCRKLGVKIVKIKSKKYKIYGKGLGSFYAKKNAQLDFCNSGTLARLLIGVLSTTPNIEVKIRGDHSLNKRNMSKLINLMNDFGATFLPQNKNNFPLFSKKMKLVNKFKKKIQ